MAVLSCAHFSAGQAAVEIRNCNFCKQWLCQVCSGLLRDRLYPSWTFHEALCAGCVAAYAAANAPYADEPADLMHDDVRQ